MIFKDARKIRQTPMQKAAGFGEGALRVIGTARALWDAGKTVYGAAQAAAPYVQAAAALL